MFTLHFPPVGYLRCFLYLKVNISCKYIKCKIKKRICLDFKDFQSKRCFIPRKKKEPVLIPKYWMYPTC